MLFTHISGNLTQVANDINSSADFYDNFTNIQAISDITDQIKISQFSNDFYCSV